MTAEPAWRLVHAGFAVEAPARAATLRAVARLGRLVDVDSSPCDGSGLGHESGTPRERAARLVAALDQGRVAVLAGGHGTVGMTGGDPLVAQVVPHLPADLAGCVIGSMAQAHVLSYLAVRHPGLRVLLGPPVLEVVGTAGHDEAAEAAAAQLVDLWRRGPRPGRLTPPAAFVGAGFWHAPSSLGEWTALEPDVLHPGAASGRVIASNLGPARPWPDLGGRLRPFEGALLFCEVGHHRLIDVDHMLQRLRFTGVLDVLAGLFIGQPYQLFENARALGLHDVVARAAEGRGYPVVAGGFAGTGFPSPLLEIGRQAEVTVDGRGVAIRWPPAAPDSPPQAV